MTTTRYQKMHLNYLAAVAISIFLAPLGRTDLLQETFDTPGAPPDDGRIYDSLLDQGWRATAGYGVPSYGSLWEITGGRMENAANVDPTGDGSRYTESETPTFQWWTNPTAGANTLTTISLSFDYGTDAADTVSAHLWAVQTGGTAGSLGWITNNQGWINGSSGQNEVNSSAGNTPFNLLDSSNAPTTGSVSGNLNGTGTFTWNVDVSTLGISGVSTIGDIDTLFIGFGANETGGGTTWVDNVSITSIPEPSTGLLFIAGSLIALRSFRKKR